MTKFFLNYRRIVPFIFFIGFLFLGTLISRDLGIAWDEPHQRTLGIFATNYILEGDPAYLSYQDKYYGSIFEVVLIFSERAFKVTNNLRSLYQLRHFLTFITFYTGTIFFHLLSKERLKDWKLALFTTAMLVVHPRILAHAFYNSKDIPFLAVSIIGAYALNKFLNSHKPSHLFLLAISTALLVAIRVTGIYLFILSIVFILLECFGSKKSKLLVVYLSAFILLTTIFTIIFWPILWHDPINNFYTALKTMSHYPWDQPILYLGKLISASDLPWHYLPMWIFISTPVAYLLLFSIGFIFSLKRTLERPIKYYKTHKLDVISLLIVSGPVVTILLLHSTVYDEWRQIFFIYPFIVLLAGIGLEFISKITSLKYFAFTFLLISFALTTSFTVSNYPFFNVYFNPLVSPRLFERDYWGVSYKQGLEFILEYDHSDKIKISTANFPGTNNIEMLEETQRQRVIFTPSIKEADYYITNYRWDPVDLSTLNKLKEFTVRNVPVIGIYVP